MKRFALARIIVASALGVLIASPVVATTGSNAKDMFYQQLKTRDESAGESVAYCLELTRAGAAPVLCNNRYPFKSGDALRLHLKLSAPAYVYIAMVGSSGKKSMLYPPPGSSENNRVEAGKECIVPPNGQLTFDNTPGTEHLAVFMTSTPQDLSAVLNGRDLSVEIGGDTLSGLPEKVGNYSVVSNDGFYDLGTKTAGSGLVFLSNPDRDKPTYFTLSLQHGQGSESQASSAYADVGLPAAGASSNRVNTTNTVQSNTTHGATVKVAYNLASLHNDGGPLAEHSEVITAIRTVPGDPQSGINGGARDQYVAGLNHLYANYVNQSFQLAGQPGPWFYTQEPQSRGDVGERMRTPSFSGQYAENPPGRLVKNPGMASLTFGMAKLMAALSGGNGVNFAVSEMEKQDSTAEGSGVRFIRNGQDLDAAWDACRGEPIVIAVDVMAKMFGQPGHGGHVVVLSTRRDRQNASAGQSRYEYRLLNSWGRDSDGKVRNGWVNGDAIASAINFTDPAHDESVPLERALVPDALPPGGGANRFARGDDGFIPSSSSERSLNLAQWIGLAKVVAGSVNAEVRARKSKKPTNSPSELRQLEKYISDPREGLQPDERAVIENAAQALLKNTDEEGKPRRYPISEKDMGIILHEANRMFSDETRIYAQGLDAADRNRAVAGMLHDTVNPEHINQGFHNTCNVTTIMKVETFLRPAAQVTRFVDMYTNANADYTVDMPI